jgi:flagellar M-ring protein FliF
MKELLAMIAKAGPMRLAAMIGLGLGVAVALTLLVSRIAEPPLGVLYAEIDLADAQSVIDRLDQEGVSYKTRERGGRIAILAPQSDIPRLRMRLAAEGEAPKGGVGYEIFDKDDAFGSTTFQQNINRLRALEGELARTIATIEGVKSARVHLVLPERALFTREREAASASIVIDAAGALDKRMVRGVVNLAASAVPGLKTSDVTVLDAAGGLLASGDEEGAGMGGADEKTVATEARLRKTVEDILGRIVGPENLRVQVSAEMDFNRITENAEIIDPDSQTVLSSVTVEEAADESQPSQGRGVTVANALPGAQTATETLAPATSNNRRTEETTNYELSRTTRTEIREQGVVNRLSIAIALNLAPAGARSAEEIGRLGALARTAVGYNEARGDSVEIVEIAFQPAAATAPAAGAAATLSRADLGRFAETGALALIALALVVFVLRPMLATPKAKSAERPRADDGVIADLSGRTALPAPGEEPERRFDSKGFDVKVKASAAKEIAEVVKSHTDESAQILKGWIRQAS